MLLNRSKPLAKNKADVPALEELTCIPCDSVSDVEFDRKLDLLTFKTQKCNGNGPASHDSKCCMMYHHRFDRRRPPDSYNPEPCEHEFLQDDSDGAVVAEDRVICPDGDDCQKCHNVVELLYHPLVYKRRLCMDEVTCPRGALCAFAHSRSELEAHAIVYTREEEENPTEDFFMHRYKTLWCPLPGVHDWDACFYAHTKRDLRRTPHAGYGTRKCPDWEKGIAAEPKEGPALPYDACCPRGTACYMAHGVKEVLYHPAVYRMKMCSSSGNCRGSRRICCAFAHSPKEVRVPTKLSLQDKKTKAWAVMREQPQFHQPLLFVSFKDSRPEPSPNLPRTPSPGYNHREISLEESMGNISITEQALHQVLDSPQKQGLLPCPDAVECTIQAPEGFVPPWNQVAPIAMPIQAPSPLPVSSQTVWHYFYDVGGNLHVWPETPGQPCGSVPENTIADMSPTAASCGMVGNPHDRLRSESMNSYQSYGSYGSYGSSTISPSTLGSCSYAESLRSDSFQSWASFESSPNNNLHVDEVASISTSPQTEELSQSKTAGKTQPSPPAPPPKSSRSFTKRITSFKEKLIPKSKSSASNGCRRAI